MFFNIAVQLPQLSDDLSLAPTTSSIVVSWSPPQFPPDSYNVSYSCQLLCVSELYLSSSDTVNGSVTTHTITSLNAGSNCTVSVTAVYGSNTSNTITSSTNTTGICMSFGKSFTDHVVSFAYISSISTSINATTTSSTVSVSKSCKKLLLNNHVHYTFIDSNTGCCWISCWFTYHHNCSNSYCDHD